MSHNVWSGYVAVSAHDLFTVGYRPNEKTRNWNGYKFVGICGTGCRHYKTKVDIYRDANFFGICGTKSVSLSKDFLHVNALCRLTENTKNLKTTIAVRQTISDQIYCVKWDIDNHIFHQWSPIMFDANIGWSTGIDSSYVYACNATCTYICSIHRYSNVIWASHERFKSLAIRYVQ